ncbi:gamma-glutamyltransferase [Parvularcula sp. IMCC14364]|uniref:gamma-glutamyltransferase n=1 Tax=Parvularcula sp. IMCC14364 TaxID=3067902 RepID=UPI0027411405|nr:gamma-glutamyltransferase [Parvularcula sp. IMCC14364]
MLRKLMTGSLFLLAACGEQPAPSGNATVPEIPESTRQYAVAAAHPLAAEAGLDILAQGGTAVDAAIAVQAVLSLVEPQSSGLAGGAFMLHYDPATEKLTSYDGRETAPASATPEMFLNEDGTPMGFYDAVTGGRSVGVPGVVAMLAMAHEKHGALPWETLLAPALDHAREGFAVTPRLHQSISRMATRGRLGQSEKAAAYFLDADGEPWPVGHVLKNPAYATTLQYLVDEGPAVFYAGQVAEEMALAVNAAAGAATMTLDDFLSYQPLERTPVCAAYRTKKICSMAPPSSGGVTVLQILLLLEQTGFAAKAPASPAAWHLLLEASRLAYADRNIFLADPVSMGGADFSADDLVGSLLRADYISDRAALIQEDRSSIEVSAGDPVSYLSTSAETPGKDASPEPPSTSHFSIIDADGRVVSMTTSVEFPFGSHLMAGGMILNNQLTDFSFLPERDGRQVANAAAAGKRPRSSMSPVIVLNEDGSVYAALGSPGGSAIIGYVAKTLVALIDWEMSLQEAIDQPNIVVPRGGVLVEDNTLDEARLADLEAFGHAVQQQDLNSGVYGFVLKADGSIEGGADSRREGVVLTGQ